MPTPAPPDGTHTLPHIFVDRSLGGIQVPAILRAAGLTLTTLSEHYGVAEGEDIDDVTWIADSASLGWVAFHKDPSIRRNVAEKQAVLEHGARLFCVPNGQVTAPMAAGRYLSNLPAIARACEQPGPFVYGVYPDRIERLKL